MGKIVEFVGFEEGIGYEDADHRPALAATARCTIVNSPTSPYGNYALKIEQHPTGAFYYAGAFQTWVADKVYITAAYFRFSSTGWPPVVGNPINNLVAEIDASANRYWGITVNVTNGELELRDNANTLLDTSSVWGGDGKLDADTWYRVEVLWTPGDDGSGGPSAPGNWAWYLTTAGNDPVLEGSGSGADFDTGSATMQLVLSGQGGALLGAPIQTYHGGAYVMEDVTDIDDRVGGQEGKTGDFVEVLTDGRITKNSATPDCDENGATGSLDDLDAGDTWDEAAAPTTEARYTCAVGLGNDEGGAVKVAAPASRQVDQIYGSKFIWHAKRRWPGTMSLVYGYYDPAAGTFTVVKSATTISTAFAFDRRIQDWNDLVGGNIHLLQGVQGIHRTSVGARAAEAVLEEAWFLTLEAVPVLTGKPSIGRFGNMWRGKKGRPL